MAQANSNARTPFEDRHGILRGSISPPKPGPVGKNEVIRELGIFGKMSDALLAMLNLPEKLHRIGEGRFSSDPRKLAFSVTHINFLEGFDNNEFADYSIAIGSRGSNVFCTLIDRQRGILVSASVKNMYVEGGDWGHFQSLLERALEAAEARTPQEKKEGRMITMVS